MADINKDKVMRHITAEIEITKVCKKNFASVDIDMLIDTLELLKEQETEIKRLKAELHSFSDLFGELSEKTGKIINREIVITHLQIIHTWASFAREHDLQFFTAKHLEDIAQWADDALKLLKEQEAQKFFVDESGKLTPLPVVVRCKDCKWYDERISMCDNCGLPREQTFFCADGERR